MQIWVGNQEGASRCFRTTPEWAAQVEEFKMIYQHFHNHCATDIKVYGEGMLPHVARIMEGFKVKPTQSLEETSHVSH